MPGHLRRTHVRNVATLAPLIGDEAAPLAVVAAEWYAIAWLLGWLGFVPLAVSVQLGAPRLVWLPAGVAALAAALSMGRSLQLSARAASAASLYASAQAGHRLRVRSPVGIAPWRWRRAIDRAQREHDELTNRAANIGSGQALEEAIAKVARENRLAITALALVGLLVGILVGFGIALLVPAATGALALAGAAGGAVGLPAWAKPRLARRRARLRKELGDALAGQGGLAGDL